MSEGNTTFRVVSVVVLVALVIAGLQGISTGEFGATQSNGWVGVVWEYFVWTVLVLSCIGVVVGVVQLWRTRGH